MATRKLIDVYAEMLEEANDQREYSGEVKTSGVHQVKVPHKDPIDRKIALALSRELYYFCAQLEATEEINPKN